MTQTCPFKEKVIRFNRGQLVFLVTAQLQGLLVAVDEMKDAAVKGAAAVCHSLNHMQEPSPITGADLYGSLNIGLLYSFAHSFTAFYSLLVDDWLSAEDVAEELTRYMLRTSLWQEVSTTRQYVAIKSRPALAEEFARHLLQQYFEQYLEWIEQEGNEEGI